jgi:hypothetical protein
MEFAGDEDFSFLARLCSWASIITMPVEVSVGEQLVKLTYTDPIQEWTPDWELGIRAGVKPLPTLIDLPYAGAQTFHLETHPPQGMAVSRGIVAVRVAGEVVRDREAVGTGRSLHLYLPELERGRSGAAPLELRAQREGFLENARNACLAVTIVLGLSIAFAAPLAKANATVPTLLLFLPGLLATVVLQPTAHPMTRRVLTGVRYAVMVCAGTAFLAAFWLIAAPQESHRVSAGTAILAPKAADPVPRTALAPAVPAPQSAPRPAVSRPEVEQARAWHEEAEPSVSWLRVVWGLLFVVSLAASGLVWLAHRRSSP